jgi:hypothetical protein
MFESLTGGTAQTNDICVAWDAYALKYLAAGYSVIPLMPKQKGPKLGGWSNYCEALMDPNTAREFCGKNNNIGLCLGPASDLCAVDIDTDDPELIRKIERLLPQSPLRKKGAKGYTVFFKYNGMASKSVKDDKGNGLDFLSNGRQTVLPPSIHPSGIEYQWLTGTTLLDVAKKDVPELPISAVEQILALFKVMPKEKPQAPLPHHTDAEYSEAQAALACLDADESYDQWVRVGLSLQAGFGDEKGFELFNEWSAKGSQNKYDGIEKCYKKYKSLQYPEEITSGTLFYLARQHGYEGSGDWGFGVTEKDEKKFDAVVDDWFGTGQDAISREEAVDIILHPVGFIKPVYEWIRKTSMYRQDLFAVAAATSFVSLVYAKRFRTFTNARTNNYLIAVGPAGCGKGRICDQAQWLVAHAPDNIRSKLIGKLRSDAGLIDALLARDGVIYAYIDEIGHYLRNIKSDGASQYTRAIGAELTELFSHADGTYSTAAYSASAKRDIVNIEFPCAVVFGQSVPNRLFESLSRSDFEDGFLPRFTLVEVKPLDRIAVDNPDYVIPSDYYPEEIYDFIKKLDSWTTQAQLTKDFMGKVTDSRDPTLEVPTTPEARLLIKNIKEDFDNKRRGISAEDLIDKPLSRAWEQMLKYALCACEYIDDRPIITENSVKWAKALIDYHLMTVEEHIPDITDTAYAKDRALMLNGIPVGKKLNDKQFHTYCKDIQPNTRKQIMDDLIHQGILEWVVDGDKKYIRRTQ